MRSTLWKQNGWWTEGVHTVSGDIEISRRFSFVASHTSLKSLINAKKLHAIGSAWLYHLNVVARARLLFSGLGDIMCYFPFSPALFHFLQHTNSRNHSLSLSASIREKLWETYT